MVRFLLILLFPFLISCMAPAQRFGGTPPTPNDESLRNQLREVSSGWLGCPYKFGGTDHDGVDCSGLVQAVYRDIFDTQLPRTAEEQYRAGRFIRRQWIRAGDLVFFKNVRGPGVDHVGVYLGNEEFLHASTSGGVIISHLNESYYQKHFAGVRRYVDQTYR